MEYGDIGPERGVYYVRMRRIGTQVMGPVFYDILDAMPAWNRDWKNPQPEAAEPLYRRALDLFIGGCERFSRDPSQYADLVTWRDEPTLHGTGHPGVREALLEECIGFSEEYGACLDMLIKKHRSLGNLADAAQYERQAQRLSELYSLIR
jgi:hypothetical protein